MLATIPVKALLLGAAGLATTGGVALAATTGALPGPSVHASETAVSAVASHRPAASSSAALSTSAADSSTSTSGATASTTAAGPTSSKAPTPSLKGLCNAWLARPHTHGKADNSAAFQVLISTAGGSDTVNSYCVTLLGRPTSTPPTTSAPSTGDTPEPSDQATPTTGKTHPTGKPTALPTPSR